MSQVYIHWVVALRPEATPIISRFNLKPVSRKKIAGSYPVWESKETCNDQPIHRLVLCGVGKINAAAATAWLQAFAANDSDETQVVAWINFGIGGHRDRELGAAIRANRVSDFASNRSWYPPATWRRKIDLESSPLRTVDSPTSDYPDEDCMVDMEASGFISTASRFSSLELVQAIKVVSDNEQNSIESITKESVNQACANALDQISPWLKAYFEIAQVEADRIKLPPLYSELIREFRFSETQRHQLRRILLRHHALGSRIQMSDLKDLKSGREVVASLNSIASE